MSKPTAVYEAPNAIPELGARRGDVIVLQPADPDPLLVVKSPGRNLLPVVLDHLPHLTPVSLSDGVPSHPDRVRAWMTEGTQHLALVRD